jgi:diguanylate cyclase (GGDEF)-like protein/PAS domain S-box-containing protein
VSTITPSEHGLAVAELAQTWAGVTSTNAESQRSGEEVEQFLTQLINRLVRVVATVPVDVQAATRVAAELVARGFTVPHGVGRSIEVLGDGLARLADLRDVKGRDVAVLRVLGALADGYAEALRLRALNEQEQAMRVLLDGKLDAERGLRVCEARFRQIFSASAVGIAVSDLDGTLVAANRAFADIVGRAPEDLIGAALTELLTADDDPTLGEAYRALANGELTHFRHQGKITAASGEVAWTFLAGSLLRDPSGAPTHHVIIAEDITELLLLQTELSEQALHDQLTGLPNQHYFMSHLRDLLEGADPTRQVTLCRVDLDSFSVINDGIGRTAGESLLRSVAGRLQELVVGKRAMVARMGTDDFAILIENGMDSRDLGTFAATINDRLSEPVYLDDRGIAVSAGVSVLSRPTGGISAEELIRAADITLHRAKRSGRGQWALYDAQFDTRQRAYYQLAAEMPGAWENGEIEVWYQPVYGLDSGLIVAIQALLHWQRTDRTLLGHSECLRLAELTGLVTVLGRWMVHEACINLAAWTACRGHSRAPHLRVDLTARLSQDPDLVAVVTDALHATGARAALLRVGVPLSALARGGGDVVDDDVVDNIGVLGDLGAEVVLLDAVASPGYLAHLEDLALRAVEIDSRTVSRIARRPGADSVVARAAREAIPLVHSTGRTVIVPGVNTPEQAQWWRGAEADWARGAHFGPPIHNSCLPPLLLAEQS